MNLQPLQFSRHHDPETNSGYVFAHAGDPSDPDSDVGQLMYHSFTGHPEVSDLHVKKEARGQGIATQMWQKAAEQTGGSLRHSPLRSDAGDSFARKVGGVIPERDVTTPWLSGWSDD